MQGKESALAGRYMRRGLRFFSDFLTETRSTAMRNRTTLLRAEQGLTVPSRARLCPPVPACALQGIRVSGYQGIRASGYFASCDRGALETEYNIRNG